MLTVEVAEREGIPVKKIQNLLAVRAIAPPKKDAGGRYNWTEDDIRRLREVALVDRRRMQNRMREGANVA
jgi:DNA-binding transcriptional MerR regulator